MSSCLLKNARLHGHPNTVDILIEDGKIAGLGNPVKGVTPTTGLDLEGRLVLPGFVNSHTHLDKALLPHTAREDVTFQKGVFTSPMLEAKRKASVEEIRARATRALAAAIQSGTTALRTHVDIDPAHGLKGVQVLCRLKQDFAHLVDIQMVAFPQEGLLDPPETRDLFREALAMGVDVVGGKPRGDADFKAHIDALFQLAIEFGRDIDMHVGTDLDTDYTLKVSRHADGHEYPDELDAVYLAERTIQLGYQGRVVASHLCALDHLPPALATNVINLLRKAGIGVIACPAMTLYLMAKGDTHDVRRGIAPVRRLIRAGVPVAYATDNLGDAFNVYAGPDMLTHGLISALACHMRTVEDLGTVLQMGTAIPARLLKLPAYGVTPGCWADLVVVDAESLYDAVTKVPVRNYVFKRGTMTAMARAWAVTFAPTPLE